MAGKNKKHEVEYVQVILLVESKNVRGVPERLRLIENEQTLNLEELGRKYADEKGEIPFITAYVKKSVLKGNI